MYINLIDGEFISDDAVVRETESGLMYFEDSCWKFLSPGEYRQVDEGDIDDTSEARISYLTLQTDELIDPKTVTEKTYRYYTDYFGLNALDIGYKKFAGTSGILSSVFDVTKGEPVYLKADIFQPDYSSIEFSVIEGSRETPILIKDQTEVVHEKVFFGLDKRMTGTNETYFRNFQAVDKSQDRSDIFNRGVIYTVSYQPDSRYQSYTPSGTKIQIKTILRIYQDDGTSPEIRNLRIVQGDE